MAQVSLNIESERLRRGISAIPIFFQAFDNDDAQIATNLLTQSSYIHSAPPRDLTGPGAQRRQPGSRCGRILLLYDPQNLSHGGAAELRWFERQRADNQLVQHNAKRVDIRACVDGDI